MPNIPTITAALRGKVLGYGSLAAKNNNDGCRCAAGELAHVAGVSDEVLEAADTADEHSIRPLHEVYAALYDTYGIDRAQTDGLIAVNDAIPDAERRVAAVVAYIADDSREDGPSFRIAITDGRVLLRPDLLIPAAVVADALRAASTLEGDAL